MKVLVVDDCADGADSLSMLLLSFGHEVRTALSGIAGIEEFARFTPQLVICDLHMPDVPGDVFAQRLRGSAVQSRPMLLSLSGDLSPAAQNRSRSAGFDAHLAKPIDLDALLAMMLAFPCAT